MSKFNDIKLYGRAFVNNTSRKQVLVALALVSYVALVIVGLFQYRILPTLVVAGAVAVLALIVAKRGVIVEKLGEAKTYCTTVLGNVAAAFAAPFKGASEQAKEFRTLEAELAKATDNVETARRNTRVCGWEVEDNEVQIARANAARKDRRVAQLERQIADLQAELVTALGNQSEANDKLADLLADDVVAQAEQALIEAEAKAQTELSEAEAKRSKARTALRQHPLASKS